MELGAGSRVWAERASGGWCEPLPRRHGGAHSVAPRPAGDPVMPRLTRCGPPPPLPGPHRRSRTARVLAERNQAVVPVGAWVESARDGPDDQHPAFVSSGTRCSGRWVAGSPVPVAEGAAVGVNAAPSPRPDRSRFHGHVIHPTAQKRPLRPSASILALLPTHIDSSCLH